MNYAKYRFFTDPTPFSEEFLIVSDGMALEENDKFIVDRKGFNNNLIMIALSGEICVEQNGKSLTLHPNEGVIMELMSQHKYYGKKGVDVKFLWMHFRGKPCESLMKKLSGDRKLPFLFSDINVQKKLYSCFQIMNESKYEYKISAAIYEMTSNIAKIAYSENSDDFMDILNNYIEKNMFSDIDLDDFAKTMHLSKYYFCRYFKKQTNMTPMNYVSHKKIETSKKLLITSNDKIEAIASELGFTDRSHFSKAFKKQTGKTPSEFRKKYLTAYD